MVTVTSVAVASVVVPGNHDGVHVGHRALLALARSMADARGARVVALTFDPHPLAVLLPERAPTPLTTIERRVELLRGAGADRVEVARFDAAYAKESAEGWVKKRLLDALGAVAIVIGPDYRFGAGRKGTPDLLRSLGLEVASAPSVSVHGERASSTRVRDALGLGDVVLARELLDRVHEVDGEVVEGDRRGRTIGFPTANLRADPVLTPRDGVYAVVARVVGPAREERLLRGMANLGTRPTFGAGRSIEAHFFDFDGDLYGRRLRLGFVARLRDEQKFAGIDALTLQLRADRAAAEKILGPTDPRWSWL